MNSQIVFDYGKFLRKEFSAQYPAPLQVWCDAVDKADTLDIRKIIPYIRKWSIDGL